ncbi:hypothetical protein CPB86DRAFT_626039 [Serendipita vermifera]|nr:hypothetical protein CPB86DRAFT_626039 [Serendipita vermifera]
MLEDRQLICSLTSLCNKSRLWIFGTVKQIGDSPDDAQPFPTNISLPRLKSCSLRFEVGMISMFDLGCMESFKFVGFSDRQEVRFLSDAPTSLMTSFSPTQVTKLELERVVINFEGLPVDVPYHFPNLTSLELEEIGLRRPLRRYFDFPQLKRLVISNVYYLPADENDVLPPPALFEKEFFRTVPKLEVLFIRDTEMGDSLVGSLHHCSSLKALLLQSCGFDQVLPALITGFQDKDFFPSLRTLALLGLESIERYSEYLQLAFYCKRVRPALEITGHGHFTHAFDPDLLSDSDSESVTHSLSD